MLKPNNTSTPTVLCDRSKNIPQDTVIFVTVVAGGGCFANAFESALRGPTKMRWEKFRKYQMEFPYLGDLSQSYLVASCTSHLPFGT